MRTIINSIIISVVVSQIPGIAIDTLGVMLLGAAVVGLANAFVRTLLSSAWPPNLFVLAGLTFFINILTFFLVVRMLPGFEMPGILSLTSLFGLLFFTLCSILLTAFIKDQ